MPTSSLRRRLAALDADDPAVVLRASVPGRPGADGVVSEPTVAQGRHEYWHDHGGRVGGKLRIVGPMGRVLLDAGWTAGAAVLVRLAGSAVVLTMAAAVTLPGSWRLRARSARALIVYGVVAMAGTQLGSLNAVRTLDVGVALLLENLAPVLLLV